MELSPLPFFWWHLPCCLALPAQPGMMNFSSIFSLHASRISSIVPLTHGTTLIPEFSRAFRVQPQIAPHMRYVAPQVKVADVLSFGSFEGRVRRPAGQILLSINRNILSSVALSKTEANLSSKQAKQSVFAGFILRSLFPLMPDTKHCACLFKIILLFQYVDKFKEGRIREVRLFMRL